MNKTLVISIIIVLVAVGVFAFNYNSQPASPLTPTPEPVATTTIPNPQGISLAEVAKHNSANSCYTAVNGSVNDVTTWISQHPGGSQAILRLCGTDGSSAFTDQHGGQPQPEAELASFKIGPLAQ
jgi:cytochrome b involved in lipid metabolism